ncbi:MAG: hypothetical protein LUI87_08215 [Lachnospiraceae bacterium]|nr:hypothetical protein [Lachnospiraceae bacterium]
MKKQNGDAVTLNAVDQTFYVALYYDEACTQIASDVKELVFKNASSSTVTFTNIEVGRTYYIGECDEDGTAELEGFLDGEGNLCYASFDDGNVAIVEEEDGSTTIYFSNEFYSIPLGYSWKGELTITKKLLDADGNALESDAVFYAGIFTDPEFTTLATADDGVSESIVAIDLAGGSEASTVVSVGAAFGTTITLYVTETDENGVPVASESDEFLYIVTIDGSDVMLTENSINAEVIITNQEVEVTEEEVETESETETETETETESETETETETETESETETGKESETTSAVQTGDDTPLAQYFSLMLLAMAALLGEFIYRRKRDNGQRKQ